MLALISQTKKKEEEGFTKCTPQKEHLWMNRKVYRYRQTTKRRTFATTESKSPRSRRQFNFSNRCIQYNLGSKFENISK